MTRAWRLYEEGRAYNARLVPDQYRLVETNTAFFAGDQWLHLPDTPAMRSLPKPTFNILKRVASLFVASLTSSNIALRFEPLAYYDGSGVEDPARDAVRFACAAVEDLLEKCKFEYRVRDALFDGARTGDYCAHFWFDPDAPSYGSPDGDRLGEIRMELVDGIDVLFGDPNVREVERQPWILLVGRDGVASLREEAARWGHDPDAIVPDAETRDFPSVGGRTEIPGDRDGKALYVLLYARDPGGTVRVTKTTRTAVLYEDIDTGLSIYPLAWGNWEKQKGQYHGRALVTGLVPNQIFINTMFATAMRHLQLMAFPKTIYNADLISAWTNEVGQAIGIRGLLPGQSVGQVAAHLQPAEMSSQIFALIDKAMAYTKECLGATDAQMGSARPDNTSALMVLQTNSEVPLENVRAGLHEWVEDIGRILLDMMGTYYGRRPVVLDREMEELDLTDAPGGPVPEVDPDSGLLRTHTVTRRVTEEFDFSVFKRLWLEVRADVGASSYFSEIAMVQTLDALRRDGILDTIGYLERMPDRLVPRKDELLRDLRARSGPDAPGGASAAVPDPIDALPRPARAAARAQRSMRADRRA